MSGTEQDGTTKIVDGTSGISVSMALPLTGSHRSILAPAAIQTSRAIPMGITFVCYKETAALTSSQALAATSLPSS